MAASRNSVNYFTSSAANANKEQLRKKHQAIQTAQNSRLGSTLGLFIAGYNQNDVEEMKKAQTAAREAERAKASTVSAITNNTLVTRSTEYWQTAQSSVSQFFTRLTGANTPPELTAAEKIKAKYSQLSITKKR